MNSNFRRIKAFALTTMAVLLSVGFSFAQVQSLEEVVKNQYEIDLHGPTVVVPISPEGSTRAIGDDCITPIVIGSFPFSDVNTTAGRGNTYSETCMGSYDGGEDIIYQFTLTEARIITITMDPLGTTWTGLGLMDACPQTTTTCLGIATGAGATPRVITQTLAAGTYYIMADTWPSPANIPSFNLTVTSASPLPVAAAYSAPGNGSAGIPISTSLNWAPGTGGGPATGYLVYMGTDNPPTNIANGVDVGNVLTYTPATPLEYATEYFWQVVPYNTYGQATGNAIWSFNTSLGVGVLEGFVTNGFGIPMGGVSINIDNTITNYTAVSDPSGFYQLTFVPAAAYTLTASFAGYNNTVQSVTVAASTTTYQNVTMLRPVMAVTPNPYSVSLNPNEYLQGAINVANNGDGVLTWTASVNYTSPAPNNWLTVAQTSGTVAAYTNFNVPMNFNATGLAAGTVKTAEITFTTSNPNIGSVVVPVTMTVSGVALNTPTNLVATLTNPVSGTVNLAWNFEANRAFSNFVVKRNGVQVAATTNTTYTETLPTYGVYSYTVTAVYEEGNSVPAGPVVVEWSNPTLVLNPTSLYNEQYPNTSEAVSFTISNTGEGTLAFSFPEYAARQLVNTPGFTPNVRSAVQPVSVEKGDIDPTDNQGNRNLRGAGGPDAFGYMWIDSDEAGGPAFVWNDIATTGTLLTGLTDDNAVGPVSLGFNFPFYGNTYGSVYVASNGFLSFDSGNTSLSNQNIPSATTPNNVIAWCWDDLHGGGPASAVYTQNMGNYWVIQFTNYNEYPTTSTGRITAQVHLYANGDVRIYYKDIVGGFDVTSATVGIENATGTIATNINYNSAYLHNNLAVWMGLPDPTFITSVVPASGQVAPGQSVDVVATFTSNNDIFPVGTHNTELALNTNDLANASVMIPATMVVYNPAMISGTVTAADDNAPIHGAVVTAGSYSATTNEDGNYAMVVDAGTYNMTFAKTGYTTGAVAGVITTETNTTVVDIELEEVLYAPTLVNAVVNAADTQTEVTWGLPIPSYEVLYDDGTAENYAAWALPGNMNAVKFTPAGYPATIYGGRVFVGDGSFPNNNTGFIGTTFGAVVYAADGANGLPGTALDSISVTVNNLGWVNFSGLNATITEGSFYLAMVQGAQSPNCAPVGIDQSIPTVYRSYSRNVSTGGAWSLSPYQDMMIRAFVTGVVATDDVTRLASKETRTPAKQRAMISQSAPLALSGVEGEGQFLAIQDGLTRDLTSYKVWRVNGFDPNAGPETGNLTLLNGTVATTNYTDAAYEGLPEGWYAYAVAANYTNGGESAKVYSNIVGHKKLVDVTVNVTLTTGGSPAGAVVSLAGQNYPYSVYTQTVPENGTVVFEDIWKNNYVLEAKKVGFDDFMITPNITSNRTFNIMLAERKYKPRNLYVDDLTLVATWDEPLAIAVIEDFEGSVFPPAGWQSITQNTNGWYATTNGSSTDFQIPPHTKYAVTNDDAANGDGSVDYLITPSMDWTGLPSFRLNFASYFDGSWGHSAYIEISTDGGATFTVIHTMAAAPGAWQNLEIDLAQFSGATGLSEVMLAFHADDNGEWGSGWAVDDVQIASGGVPHQGYGVFLDGTLVDNTPETTFLYTNLNYGQEYLAGVAALFSSGYSELDTYKFRSRFLSPPQNLEGISPAQTDYAHLWWEEPAAGGGVGGSLVEDFEAGVLSAGWEIIQTNNVSNNGPTPSFWTVNDYVSADFSPFGTYHAGLWWDYGHQDEWLITPEVNIGAGTTLTFESAVFEGSTNADHYYVKVSTDGGSTWTIVWDASALTGGGWNYYDYAYSIDLTAFAGQSVKIAFNAVDGDNQGLWYIWFIDNISVGNTDEIVMFPAASLTKISNSSNRGGNDQIARDGNTNRVSNSAVRSNRAVMGLIGYNLYRDNALAAYVQHPTTEYYDLNLMPDTYTYHVTAVYDLTPYGFAGQTGESMIEGPIDVTVSYGYELPFTENFNTGLFETNQWTVNGGNWRIAGQVGNDAPSAEFYFSPVTNNYSQSITSYFMIGTGIVDGKIMLDFDLKHTLVNATEAEFLAVEVFNGSAWVKVAEYKNTANINWETKSIDITAPAKGKVFRVRFTASGAVTTDIFNWLVDNVNIYRVCAPATELTAVVNLPFVEQVLLNWESPTGGTGPGVSAWLGWDNGVNEDAIGLQGGGTFNVAVRFTPAQLAQYAGTSLTKIRMFPYSPGGSISLKVWTGSNASTLVLTQPIASYTAGEWNEFTLNTPIMVTGATELWFGYAVTHGADYVAGCDGGPAVAGFGDMLSLDGSVWESMATAYGLNYNWNLNGYVETIDGVTSVLQPVVDETVYGTSSSIERGNYTSLPGAVLSTEVISSRALVGYNIYRDGEMIGSTTETTYIDADEVLALYNTYCYTVVAVYDDCESEMTEEACVLLTSVPVVDNKEVSIYPNPSNSVVNIEVTSNISQVVVYNYLGQVVIERNVTGAETLQVNVRNYEAGAYLVKFVTKAGETFTKKVVVTK